MRLTRLYKGSIALSLIAVLLLLAGPLRISSVSGANLATRELRLGDSRAAVTTTYRISMSGQSAGTVGSVRLQLCREDPFPGAPCTAPSGLDFTGSTLASQTGMTGFTIDPSTTVNELVLTRTPAPSVAGEVVFEIANTVNPDTVGTYYGRLETFVSTDATGASTDASGLAFAIIPDQLTLQTEVPPYLLFCVGNTIQPYDCSTANGNYIDFGNFSPTRTATGQTQALVATNAEYGYSVRVLGTTLTSGNNTIAALSSPDVSRIGVSQFGLNLRANGTPVVGKNPQGSGTAAPATGYATPNYYKFISGDVLASSASTDEYKLYTISYIVNVSPNQAPGVYVSTLQYIALATF